MAVASYRKAVQAAPDNAHYKIALQRAMLAASRAAHRPGQTIRADGSARSRARRIQAGVGVRSDQSAGGRESRRPRPDDSRARRSGASEAGDPDRRANAPGPRRRRRRCSTSRRRCAASASTTRACATSWASSPTLTGINVTYDRQYQDRQYTVQLDGVTLEQALNQILSVNQLVVQGAERAVDPDLRRQRAEARAVRRPGHPDVLPLERRRRPRLAQLLSRRSVRQASRFSRPSRRTRRRTRSRSARRRRWSRSSRRSFSRTTSRAPRSSWTSRSWRSTGSA